jgi:PAS domain S-box-containing protein
VVRERKFAMLAFLKSEGRFRQFFETQPEWCYMISPDGIVLDVNPAACEALGYTREELIGKAVSVIYAPESHSKTRDLVEKWKQTGRLESEEMVVRTRDGERRVVLVNAGSVVDAEGNLLHSTSVHVDITERKRAEEALADMSRKLIEAQEQERARIGRELHDDINQRLALLSVEIHRMREASPVVDGELRNRMDELGERTSEISTVVQSLSHELHSSKLELIGLVPAMKGFCREFGAKHKVEIDFDHGGVQSIPSRDISLCLFRVMQEGLHNAVKHSGVNFFEVKLSGSPKEIRLTVRDLGNGFDPELIKDTQGLGLVSMQERVRLVNGTILITSKLHSGTEVNVSIPLLAGTQTKRAMAAGA